MFRLSRVSRAARRPNQSPLDLFLQIQLGAQPPIAAQRAFIIQNFQEELKERRLTEAKVYSMDMRLTFNLLRELLFNRYLNVPFRLFTFDMEFTSAPNFTASGPTEEIIEIGIFSPANNSLYSSLVLPTKKSIDPQTTKLTGISPEMLKKDGKPFLQVWEEVVKFLNTPEPKEPEGSCNRILMLSHGGKLADVSMLQWTLKAHGLEMPEVITFGDTFHIVRDLHRRRPVTPDKHPPSWKLSDLVDWLKVKPSTEGVHRAGDDAKLTWDAVSHTLDRFGDEALTPRQQLITRFFDDEAKRTLAASGSCTPSVAASPQDDMKMIEELDLNGIGNGN